MAAQLHGLDRFKRLVLTEATKLLNEMRGYVSSLHCPCPFEQTWSCPVHATNTSFLGGRSGAGYQLDERQWRNHGQL